MWTELRCLGTLVGKASTVCTGGGGTSVELEKILSVKVEL